MVRPCLRSTLGNHQPTPTPRSGHPVVPAKSAEAIEKADPTGWAARLRNVLGCPRLVSALVMLLILIGSLVGWGIARLTSAEGAADTAKSEAARAHHRVDLLDQQMMMIDRTTQRTEAKIDRIETKLDRLTK